jgi:TfoX/Sxy family transcriptional regulator of competence genes
MTVNRTGERERQARRMGADDELADAVRGALAGLDAGTIREVKMFGGLGFMLNGNLLVAASRRGLLVRIGKESQREALERPGARPMVMRGRVMESYVYVDPPELADGEIGPWIDLALRFVRTLPAKASRKTAAKSRRGQS